MKVQLSGLSSDCDSKFYLVAALGARQVRAPGGLHLLQRRLVQRREPVQRGLVLRRERCRMLRALPLARLSHSQRSRL